MNKKTITMALIAVAGVLVIGALVYLNYPDKSGISGDNAQFGQQIAEKAINFINNNILRGNGTASLVDVGEENGFYKIKFSLQGNEMESYITKDGKFLFPEVINLEETSPVAVETDTTLGSFSVNNGEICKEGDKPVVYFFGSKTCPYCNWEYPIFKTIMEKFKKEVFFRDNMDLQADEDIFNKYSTGGIATIVLGCKYYRVGSGETGGEEAEIKNITALTCKITGSNPSDICDEVKDLISQIQ